ncbi:MAG: KUP/HAK/KT family potassium transporter, partial [Gemmatimonadales bacterium]
MSAGSPSTEDDHPHAVAARGPQLFGLCLATLGVVYGDIGTSPLYAFKECFAPEYGLAPTVDNVLGVLSLVFWSLNFVITFKYLTFIMRADNRGEGGIMALLALLHPRKADAKTRRILIMFGLFGSALLYGDGVITPAISVLSAVEGLAVATSTFSPFVVPVTCIILIVLFAMQKRGTGGIGAVFGPMTVIWFISIAAAGFPWIVRHPEILRAVNPFYAARFFAMHRGHGFLVLGSVVLCVTGGEALYADMGHFGTRAIRLAWYACVFPA